MVIKRSPTIENTKEQKEKIIVDYITKLEQTLKDSDLQSFWVFADRSGFKKIKGINQGKMQKILKTNVKKYANRELCQIKIIPSYKPDKYGTYLLVSILVLYLDGDANMQGREVKTNSCEFLWSMDDFKITKFSFKLIERMMHIVANYEHSCTSFMGFHIEKVINDMKKRKIDISECLTPLSGI
jgi:hypothetical protein